MYLNYSFAWNWITVGAFILEGRRFWFELKLVAEAGSDTIWREREGMGLERSRR